MFDNWPDENGDIRHSSEEIAWMEELDLQDMEDDIKRWATKSVKNDILVPIQGISLEGKQIFFNRYTEEICFENGRL